MFAFSTAVDAFDLLLQAVNVKYSFVIAVTLLIYDTIISLPDEINLIWSQCWSFGKVFYILTRYLNFLDTATILWYSFDPKLTIESCRRLYETGMWLITIGITICHVVLVVRTYAIWERSHSILAYLISIQIATFVIEVFQLDQAVKSITFTPSPVPTIVPCIPTLGNNGMFRVFCIVLGFEGNILCLLFYKAVSQWRRDSTPLIHALYRDGFIYFAVLFAISLSNTVVVLKFFESPYYYVTIQLQRVFHSILASRLIIKLRKVMASKESSLILSNLIFERFPEDSSVGSSKGA
ncbi:hypothetical protein SCHPADRAFT_901857 [Schizopora paradoxa]|uniref:DUF6533 domain-containing protein n=1 Tax=Schizopora paradoxa TaxID=27342 RepID=A0A0H2RW44_9AGAM|nr:hypothetical protein SCHPADRAFT_901857 [Schizopora paradoxa]